MHVPPDSPVVLMCSLFPITRVLLVPLEIYRSSGDVRISHFKGIGMCSLFLSPNFIYPSSILSLIPEVRLISFFYPSESSSVFIALTTSSRYPVTILSYLCQCFPLFSQCHSRHTPSLFINHLDQLSPLSTPQPPTLVQVSLPLVWTIEPAS